MIGRFPIAQTVFGYVNQILIGHIRERHVVRKKAAVCREESYVTSLKTAAEETTKDQSLSDLLYRKTKTKKANVQKRAEIPATTSGHL